MIPLASLHTSKRLISPSSSLQPRPRPATPSALRPLSTRPMQLPFPSVSSLLSRRTLPTSSHPSSTMLPAVSTSTFSSLATMLPELPAWGSGVVVSLALLALTAGAVSLAAWLDARLKARVPSVDMQPTPFNVAVLSRCPTLRETYRPTPFLTNGHVETILASLYRGRPLVNYRREFLRASDGGIVTLDWEHFEDPSKDLPADAPVLILLPGLTGGSGCSYVLHAVHRARRHGIRAVVFNSRGTADSPVVTPQFYSASFTGDMHQVVQHVQQLKPNSLLLAAGWSLGANIMMRYLGEQGDQTPLSAAVSMCNPFNLTISNANFEKGFNKIYDKNLAQGLKKIFEKHEKVFTGIKGPARPDLVPLARTVREFDEALTIRVFGWPSVDAYYAGSSSSLSVPLVRIPLLCVQALDDPIAPEPAIPYAELKENPNCVLVCTPTGGHLGWVSGPGGLKGEPWTDQVMAEWLDSVLLELRSKGEASGPGANGNGNGNGSQKHAQRQEQGQAREEVGAPVMAAAAAASDSAPEPVAGPMVSVPEQVPVGGAPVLASAVLAPTPRQVVQAQGQGQGPASGSPSALVSGAGIIWGFGGQRAAAAQAGQEGQGEQGAGAGGSSSERAAVQLQYESLRFGF